MSARETINNHPKVAGAIVASILLLAVAWLFLRSSGDSIAGPAGVRSDQAWYTVDDGKTLFPDSISKDPPFPHEGKPAYRAHVFTTDGGKTQYVNHLERYSDYAKRMIEAEKARAHENPADDPGMMYRTLESIEVKRPGETRWIKLSSPEGQALQKPKEGATRVTP